MTCRIQYEVNNDMLMMVLYHEDHEGSRYFFGGLEPVRVPRGQKPPDHVKHSITTIQMIELMDAMIAYGIRPSSDAWSSGHLADMKKHIGFAEQVAFKLLEKSNG